MIDGLGAGLCGRPKEHCTEDDWVCCAARAEKKGLFMLANVREVHKLMQGLDLEDVVARTAPPDEKLPCFEVPRNFDFAPSRTDDFGV